MSDLSDQQKLHAYAEEVGKMLTLQQKYFKTSAEFKKGNGVTIARDVEEALTASKKQESRVRKLTEKILSPQTTLL